MTSAHDKETSTASFSLRETLRPSKLESGTEAAGTGEEEAGSQGLMGTEFPCLKMKGISELNAGNRATKHEHH